MIVVRDEASVLLPNQWRQTKQDSGETNGMLVMLEQVAGIQGAVLPAGHQRPALGSETILGL